MSSGISFCKYGWFRSNCEGTQPNTSSDRSAQNISESTAACGLLWMLSWRISRPCLFIWLLNSHANIFKDTACVWAAEFSFFLFFHRYTKCFVTTSHLQTKTWWGARGLKRLSLVWISMRLEKITMCSLFSTCQTNMQLTFLYSKRKTHIGVQTELCTTIQTKWR